MGEKKKEKKKKELPSKQDQNDHFCFGRANLYSNKQIFLIYKWIAACLDTSKDVIKYLEFSEPRVLSGSGEIRDGLGFGFQPAPPASKTYWQLIFKRGLVYFFLNERENSWEMLDVYTKLGPARVWCVNSNWPPAWVKRNES